MFCFRRYLFKGISKNPYYLFGLTFNSSPLERKRSVFTDALDKYNQLIVLFRILIPQYL